MCVRVVGSEKGLFVVKEMDVLGVRNATHWHDVSKHWMVMK